jgi:hypothetical protein
MRNLLTKLTGNIMRVTGTSFRFGKEYRWGVTRWNRFVYACICTFRANNIADDLDYTD